MKNINNEKTEYVFRNGKYISTPSSISGINIYHHFKNEVKWLNVSNECRKYINMVIDKIDNMISSLTSNGYRIVEVNLNMMVIEYVEENAKEYFSVYKKIYIDVSGINDLKGVIAELKELGFNDTSFINILKFHLAKTDKRTFRFYQWLLANGRKTSHIIEWHEENLNLPEAAFRWFENNNVNINTVLMCAHIYINKNTRRDDDFFMYLIMNDLVNYHHMIPRGINTKTYKFYNTGYFEWWDVYQYLHIDTPAKFNPRLLVRLGKLDKLTRAALIKYNLLKAIKNNWKVITNGRMDWSILNRSRKELLKYVPPVVANKILLDTREYVSKDYNIANLEYKNIKAIKAWYSPDIYVDYLESMIKLVAIFGNFNRALTVYHKADSVNYYARLFKLATKLSAKAKEIIEKNIVYICDNINKYKYLGQMSIIEEIVKRGIEIKTPTDLRKNMLEILLEGLEPEIISIAIKVNLEPEAAKWYNKKYLKYKNKIKDNNLPEFRYISEDGKYVYKSLDAKDPMNLMVGEFTSCCQVYNGAGVSCAKHAYKNPDGGIFAVYQDGIPVVQSWVWRRGDVIVLDSIEAHGKVNDKDIIDLISKLPDILRNSNLKGVKEVRIGDTDYGITPRVIEHLKLKRVENHLKPKKYKGYIDGKKQVLLARL